ncbi:MAG: lipoprotein [Thermodesulfovibrionales bacterium]
MKKDSNKLSDSQIAGKSDYQAIRLSGYPDSSLNKSSVRYLLLFIVLTLFTACGGKKEVKQVSPESKISQEAFSVAEILRSAYLKRDFSTIADNCTEAGYKDIIDSIKHFDSAELTFTPRWVEIEKSKVYLNITWKGSWTIGGDVAKERGMAVFLFEGRPLKLSKIVRGNPFQYPEK